MQFLSFGRALGHRNFRLFFVGQSVSLIGTWMQQVALAWLVFELTRSAWWLGVVGFSAQIPTFFLAPFAGVFIDHWNRHRLIIVTQVLAMLQAVAVALLAYLEVIEIWHIIGLNVFLGLVHAFDIPARQALLVDLVGHSDDLSNAIALNSSMVNGARLLGPALAGILLIYTRPAFCFMLNALSFVAVLASLFTIRLLSVRPLAVRQRLLLGLAEGLRYAFGHPPIRTLLLLAALVSFMGASYMTLMPIFATQILGSGTGRLGLLQAPAGRLGFLQSAAGIGALLAAFHLALRSGIAGLSEWIAAAPAVIGLGLIAFSYSQLFWVSFVLVLLIGFGVMTHMASTNTVLQSLVDEDKRGRVMALYTMAFMGTIPLGSLAAGFLASLVGEKIAVRLGGGVCLLAAVFLFTRLPRFRALLIPTAPPAPVVVTDPPQ